jgi:hypothetical protein
VDATSLMIEIARCPNVQTCLTSDEPHPCRNVVAAQHLPRSRYHVPEPWNGRIETAPILFVSSNPSFSPSEKFPLVSWADDRIEEFFTTRFDHTEGTARLVEVLGAGAHWSRPCIAWRSRCALG